MFNIRQKHNNLLLAYLREHTPNVRFAFLCLKPNICTLLGYYWLGSRHPFAWLQHFESDYTFTSAMCDGICETFSSNREYQTRDYSMNRIITGKPGKIAKHWHF